MLLRGLTKWSCNPGWWQTRYAKPISVSSEVSISQSEQSLSPTFPANEKLRIRVLTENFVTMKRSTSRLSAHFFQLRGSEMWFSCEREKHCSVEATRKLLSRLAGNQLLNKKILSSLHDVFACRVLFHFNIISVEELMYSLSWVLLVNRVHLIDARTATV